MNDIPDWGDLGRRFRSLGSVLSAQAALGWMMQGELEKARSSLDAIPADDLRKLSVSALSLSSLADEVLQSKDT